MHLSLLCRENSTGTLLEESECEIFSVMWLHCFQSGNLVLIGNYRGMIMLMI